MWTEGAFIMKEVKGATPWNIVEAIIFWWRAIT